MVGIVIYVILGVLFCLYGVSVRMVGSGTGFFMIWFAAGLLCFLHAAAIKVNLWEKIPHVLRVISFVVFGIILFLFVIVEGMILCHFSDKGEEKLDYIIVLGAQIYDSGPSVVLKYRLDTAAEYLQKNSETMCIVTGGQGYNEPYAEALGMKNYLVSKGIPEARIIMENRALNTVQNVLYSTELLADGSVDLKEKRVGIVTNNFHVYRGVSIAKKQGFTHVCGISAGSHRYYLPNNLLREFCGVCKDRLFGNL